LPGQLEGPDKIVRVYDFIVDTYYRCHLLHSFWKGACTGFIVVPVAMRSCSHKPDDIDHDDTAPCPDLRLATVSFRRKSVAGRWRELRKTAGR
jgi:hypothetical protein